MNDDIVAKIYELNSDSVVIVMTQYNPYNTTYQDMHNLVVGYFIGGLHVEQYELLN